MTPEPEAQDETATNSDDSPADGIEGDHGGQHECQDHQGCSALPVPMSLCVQHPGAADQQRGGEQGSAGMR
jgi:hypothetical protein